MKTEVTELLPAITSPLKVIMNEELKNDTRQKTLLKEVYTCQESIRDIYKKT